MNEWMKKKTRTDGSCSLNAHLPNPNPSIVWYFFSLSVSLSLSWNSHKWLLSVFGLILCACCEFWFESSRTTIKKNQCANTQIKWILPSRTNDPNIHYESIRNANCVAIIALPIIRLGLLLPEKVTRHPQINRKEMRQNWFRIAFNGPQLATMHFYRTQN